MIPYILFIFISLFSLQKYRNNQLKLISLVILILFIGLRSHVGIDYANYAEHYNYFEEFYNYYGFSNLQYEFLYEVLNLILHKLGLKYYWVTLISAFITLYFFYKATLYFTPYYGFALFLFLTLPHGYGFVVNGQRQAIAMAIFYYSVKFIIEKKIYNYIFWVIIASQFHKSAILLLPFYLVNKIKINRPEYLIFFVCLIFFSHKGYFQNAFLKIIELSPYEHYFEQNIEALKTTKTNTGLGFLFHNIIGILILAFSSRFYSTNKKTDIIFNMYFLFLLFRNLFFGIGVLFRFVAYFEWFSFITIPLFCNRIFDKCSSRLIKATLITAFIILFIIGITNDHNQLQYKSIFNNK